MRNVKIGCPGYILSNEMSENMDRTLLRVADLGFDGIELTGFFGKTAQEIANACRKASIEPFSCFVSATEILRKTPLKDSGNCGQNAYAFKLPGTTQTDAANYLKELGVEYVSLLNPNIPITTEILKDICETAELLKAYSKDWQH